MTTGNWSVGSISTHIGDIIGWTNISSISGTTLNNIIEQEINFVEELTSDTIDSSSIPEKYQPAIINLAQSKVLLSIEASEGGVDNVKLGELSISSGKGSNASLAIQLRNDAITRLKELSRTVRFKKVIGA